MGGEQKCEKISSFAPLRFGVIVIALFFSLTAFSQGVSWYVANGDWSVPANWGGTEPTSSMSAYIDNNGTASITLAGECCKTLYIGDHNPGAVQMTSGTFSAETIYVAYMKIGVFSQSGGSSTITDIVLGEGLLANGTYHLTDTGQLVADRMRLGYMGTGIFNHSGGSNQINIFLTLGERPGSKGMYNLSGTGHLIADLQYIGFNGQGTFAQTGGVNTASDIYLGDSDGSSGTYELSGDGQLISDGYENIGYYGTGIFSQSGGTNFCHTQYVGYHNQGEYNHSAGSNSVKNNFFLGYSTGGSGTYNLSGTGYFFAKKEMIGCNGMPGLFNQSGGTNSSAGITITATGEYRFTGGTMEISGGLDCWGTLDFGSGAATLRATAAIVNLARPGSIVKNTEGATVEIDANSLLIVPNGFDPATAFAHYNNAGLLLTRGTTLVVPEGRAVVGCGEIDDRVACQGSISVSAGQFDALHLNNGIIVSGSGNVKLGWGNLIVEDSDSGMSSGTLSSYLQYIGKTGAGSFNHSGGTNKQNLIRLGYDAGATGSYFLNGSAHVDAIAEYVGCSGKGTFEHTAGLNDVDGLYLGQSALGEGTYSLSGSGQLNAGSEYIGDWTNSKGTFNHSAGSNTILYAGEGNSGSLVLGYATGSKGTYNLSGTGELFASSELIGSSGIGVFNQSGGTNTVDKTLFLRNGTYNLTGGILAVKAIWENGVFNFGGGTLKANADFSATLSLKLTGTGGDATIDTNANHIELTSPLTGAGGLVKRGDGTLTLARPSSPGAYIGYTGNTVVQGGTLEIAAGISYSGTSLLDIQSGKVILKNVNVNKPILKIVTAPSATFDVASGIHVVGTISGGGTTRVLDHAKLTALSINQDTLVIGGSPASAAAAVPEPSFSVFLTGGILFLLVGKAKRFVKKGFQEYCQVGRVKP